MKYWLMKSEPDVWSIDQQKKAGIKGAPWDGVRNYQAAKNLKNMKKGDLCFFYHSNIGKEIVGIVKVTKESYIDKTDKTGRFVAVTVQFESKFSGKKGALIWNSWVAGCQLEIQITRSFGALWAPHF